MNIEIKQEKDNPLLSRKEVSARILFEGATPKRTEIQKAIAKETKAKEAQCIIKTIKTDFGNSGATATAYIYNDEEIMKKIERKNLLEKHEGHQPKKEESENSEK